MFFLLSVANMPKHTVPMCVETKTKKIPYSIAENIPSSDLFLFLLLFFCIKQNMYKMNKNMFGAIYIQYYFHWPEEKYFKKKINYLYTFLFYYNLFITDTTYFCCCCCLARHTRRKCAPCKKYIYLIRKK